MDLGISGRVALVTGAGRGLGAAVARALAKEGATVVVGARTLPEVEKVAAGIVADGGRALPFRMDVSDPDSVRAAYSVAAQGPGHPTLVVHAAASHAAPRHLHDLTDADVEALLKTDVEGAVHVLRAGLPAMMLEGFGRIVLVGALAATQGVPGGALYGMAKAGFEGLAASVSLDYARHGVTATALRVGLMASERVDARAAKDPERKERLRGLLPSRRLPTPEEVARSVLFLCSESAWTLAGATLTCAGGGQLAVPEAALNARPER